MGSSEMSGRPDFPWRDSPKKPVEPTSGLGPMDGRGRRSDGRDRLNANRRPASPDPAGHSRLTTKEKGSHEATYCDLPKWCCAHTTTAYARLYDAATGPPVGSGVRWWRRGRGRQMLDAPQRRIGWILVPLGRIGPSVLPSSRSRRLPCLLGAEARGLVARSCGASSCLVRTGDEARGSNLKSKIRRWKGTAYRGRWTSVAGVRLPRDG